jgi:hypothetical protein
MSKIKPTLPGAQKNLPAVDQAPAGRIDQKAPSGESAVVFVRGQEGAPSALEDGDPLTTWQGLEKLADRVYRVGGEGPDDRALAVAAQVLLRAEERMKTGGVDKDVAQLHRSGFRGALQAQDGKPVEKKDLDAAASQLIDLVAQYLT